MSGNVKNALRLLRVARILARHDALFLLDDLGVAPAVCWMARMGSIRRGKGRAGERLARALQQAGPSFIKLGQALSTRSDLFGEEMCEDLSHLQDRLTPFSGLEARAAIEAEFGAPMDTLFSDFDDNAIAAASIAQVHFATTVGGREVAVKVLRPGIEGAFRRDLALFRWVASLVVKAAPETRRLKPVESVEIMAETVEMEMDLRFEAAAANELAENFDGDPTFHVPAVDWSLTGKRVLTTERISGIPIDDRNAVLAAGHDPIEVLEHAANAFFNQVFRDGFFHADLHPGNMFVAEDGTVIAVDFGIMGRLDLRNRRYLGEMLLGFLTRDFRRVSEIHFEAGWVPPHKSVESFAQASRAIAEPILERPQNEISIARLLGLLFHVAKAFEMEAQPQLLLLQKTMLVAEGTARSLAPEANMWFMARPLIEDWVMQNLGPEARVRDAVNDAVDTVKRLPRVIERLEEGATMIAEGRLKLDPETVRALRGDNGSGSPSYLGFWVWAAFAAALLGFLVLG